ncbi:BatA domain-containing protein [Gilvibacter sediminis]|uniref:BatA domain-containing protein n=1 Tax=Gilvibacter sediminis TaxID=379071 RepID=UPI002350F6AB|nr:BatA domain-containing protein [Gilvibacter sediminis]MDC7998231.1 BatA domain-containing protein [Gilvibacter sediminis]
MQFRNPEIFYGLLLLLIPILVHLFQLRRFVKVPFTNVAFLKEIQLKTRKSSKLKKWLVLSLRCLALAALVTAFAQPFLSEQTEDQQEDEYVFYLDNSFSMTARDQQGTLLSKSVQDLYDNPPLSGSFKWFTNDNDFNTETEVDFRNSLLEIGPSYKQYSYKEILLKASGLFSKADTRKRLILLSDFQVNGFGALDSLAEIDIQAVKLETPSRANVSIDTAYVQSNISGGAVLKVSLSASVRNSTNYPVSLWQGETLAAKSAVSFDQNLKQEVEFPIDLNTPFLGRLSVNDQELEFDNELYFAIGKNTAIKVMSINQADEAFLDKLFSAGDFELTHFNYNAADYNAILQQNVVVLNELERVPASLATALARFKEEGGMIIIIPSAKADLSDYTTLLQRLEAGTLSEPINQERKLNTINFDHPLFSAVFSNTVSNFQYPTVYTFFDLSSGGNDPLSLEGGNPFLVQFQNVYVFGAPLSSPHSNFKESPLIVPTFYNMGRSALPLPILYYEIGKNQQIGLATALDEDQIVSLKGVDQDFIPLQQRYANKVVLTTETDPAIQGHYFALNNADTLAVIPYNNSRKEADLQHYSTSDLTGITLYNSVDDMLLKMKQQGEQRPLWQWFVILAVLFLIAEMAVLRFLK